MTTSEPHGDPDVHDDTPPHGDPLLAAAQGHPQGEGSRHGWDAHAHPHGDTADDDAGSGDTADPPVADA